MLAGRSRERGRNRWLLSLCQYNRLLVEMPRENIKSSACILASHDPTCIRGAPVLRAPQLVANGQIEWTEVVIGVIQILNRLITMHTGDEVIHKHGRGQYRKDH
jgi:hypothetical protein